MSSTRPRKHNHHRRRPNREPQRGPRREHIEELHPLADPPEVESFDEWDLGEEIQRAIKNMDIVVPTPIQSLSIGPVLEGRDVIAKAETGTGKTLAFGAPMMARIDPARATVLALVLCPTRELALQVSEVLASLALPRGVRVALVVGGDPMHPQIAALQAGAQVVVGTPGRVLDLYEQRFLSFPWAEYAVLDEADKMFEIGFLDDVKKILSYMPDERQTLLFSATFPTEVLKLARSSTREPVEVATAKGTTTVDSIDQRWMAMEDEDRPLILARLIEQSGPKDIFLVFCERRTDVDRLMRRMERLPFATKALHGGYDQAARFRVMTAFRTGEVKALVATDVASRGLDVLHVTHVVNFGVPRELEDYAHRIGRTGRAGRTGIATTFVTHLDRRRWKHIEDKATWPIEEIPPPGRTGSDRGGSPPRSRRREGEDSDTRRGSRDRGGERRERSDGRRSSRPYDTSRRSEGDGGARRGGGGRGRTDEARTADDRGSREPRREGGSDRPRGGRGRGGRGRGRDDSRPRETTAAAEGGDRSRRADPDAAGRRPERGPEPEPRAPRREKPRESGPPPKDTGFGAGL